MFKLKENTSEMTSAKIRKIQMDSTSFEGLKYGKKTDKWYDMVPSGEIRLVLYPYDESAEGDNLSSASKYTTESVKFDSEDVSSSSSVNNPANKFFKPGSPRGYGLNTPQAA